ncbi:MAG: hypothetical protein M0C28_06405 [Candidatus Moduliflexus flocculans]|nr:hypothetical protein [Candidatus Moduliflexus flocculans]
MPGILDKMDDRARARARPCSATALTTLQHAELWQDAPDRGSCPRSRRAARGLGLDQDSSDEVVSDPSPIAAAKQVMIRVSD